MTSTGRNVALLAARQAMLFSNSSTLASINGLAGMALATNPALGTLKFQVASPRNVLAISPPEVMVQGVDELT